MPARSDDGHAPGRTDASELKELRRYIATKGLQGSMPDWYPSMQAAKYLNVPWWDLLEQSVWYRDKALIAMSAEAEAQNIKPS